MAKQILRKRPWQIVGVALLASGLALAGNSPVSSEGNGSVNEPLIVANSFANHTPRLEGKATVEMFIEGHDQRIIIQLNGEEAPITAGNFADLVERGVYDGVTFHRVVREPQPFVVQGGDPQSRDPNFPPSRLGTGGFRDPQTNIERSVPLEIQLNNQDVPVYSQAKLDPSRVVLPHYRGAIAMARSQVPDSASSQFYFALADLQFLDGNYAVFGYVTEGMEVIDATLQGDRIKSVRIIKGAENLVR